MWNSWDALGRGISRPIRAMTWVMDRLASEDLDVAIQGRSRTDELGEMARALEVFRQTALERLRLDAHFVEEQVASEGQRALVERLIVRSRQTSHECLGELDEAMRDRQLRLSLRTDRMPVPALYEGISMSTSGA